MNEAMKDLSRSAGKVIAEIDRIPKGDARYRELWEYKCKLQNLLADWEELLKKWDEETQSPLVN